MLTNAINLLNNFLNTIDFSQNKFKESDFKQIEHQYHGYYMIAEKHQWVTYEGYTFRVYITCEIEKTLDEISEIKFSSHDINDNNYPAVVEYLSILTIKFASSISFMLYLSLDKKLLNESYERALYKSKQKFLKFDHKDPYSGGVVTVFTSSELYDLKYRVFLCVLVNDNDEIMMIYVIDLYNQLL
ncbi:MAG: hypothetical protein LUG12_06065 [Erysipelotrichaceae bacterium]|nr:hypothetical protein [Erysipelotrichaceae bacterium]